MCTDRLQAAAFLIEDFEGNMRARWIAALNGGRLLSKSFVEDGSGPCVIYKRATSYMRCVWMSDAFQASHAELAHIVKAACNAAGSKWRLLQERDDFLRQVRRNRSGPQYISALANKAELKARVIMFVLVLLIQRCCKIFADNRSFVLRSVFQLTC